MSKSNLSTGKLVGKVALIIGATNENGRSIAAGLAEQGADIAFLYPESVVGNGSEMEIKRAVEENGRSCLMVGLPDDELDTVKQVVQDIKEEFGRLDYFIDNRDTSSSSPQFSDWHILMTALNAIMIADIENK